MNYENIQSTTKDSVGIVTLDRPDALNALSDDLMRELAHNNGGTFVGLNSFR